MEKINILHYCGRAENVPLHSECECYGCQSFAEFHKKWGDRRLHEDVSSTKIDAGLVIVLAIFFIGILALILL